jgi:hypothetical protein
MQNRFLRYDLGDPAGREARMGIHGERSGNEKT